MTDDKSNPADPRHDESAGAERPAGFWQAQAPASRGFGRAAWIAFALAVLVLAAMPAYGYLSAPVTPEANRMAQPWYGNWGAVAFAVAFFSIFVLGFLRSPRQREWRHLGVTEAYLVRLIGPTRAARGSEDE